jgi:IS30 family transposase
MKRRHLQRNDRNQIEILLGRGYMQKEIATVLEFNKSSISKEIRRHSCTDGYYRAKVAQHKADIKRRNSKYQGMKIQKDTQLQENIVTALQSHQSPDAIAGRIGGISTPSIYKWLYSIYGQQYCKLLCFQRYKPRKRKWVRTKREMIPHAVSAGERPVAGIHWEGDLFVSSSKLPHSVSVAVIVEQSTQYIKAIKIPNRKPSTMVHAVQNLIQGIVCTDITFDRGIENKYHTEFPVPSYFCDPHAPWQKPHVENNIGLLRKLFVSKKTNLACMKRKDLQKYVTIVNRKWRKSLGYMSSEEKARECGIIKRSCD